MKQKKKLGINALMNMSKSIMAMLFPLITFPYASRVLSVDNIGKVNYASSIVSYFALFAMLGIPVYATREGAGIREDKIKLENFISEVFTLNVFAAIVASLILITVTFTVDSFNDYKILLMIYALQIPLSVIGTDWINSIFEDYLYITVRTILFQLIGLILIFSFVRSQGDYYKYALCLVITSYGAEILNSFYTHRYCRKKIVFSSKMVKHIKPICILFATNLAALIYTSADTTMLGMMTTDYNVGIYTTAAKVYGIFKQLAFAVVIVCLPRFSFIVANESRQKYEKLSNILYKIVFTLAVPLAMGIFFLSRDIVEILAGKEFVDAVYPLKLLSVAILFAILAYFVMQLILLPNKKDSVILKATVVSGIFNIVANYFLIKQYIENAAAFTTVISELMVFIITWFSGRKIIKLELGMKNIISVIVSSVLMGGVLYWIESMEMGAVITLLVGFFVGATLYLTILIVMKNEIVTDGIILAKSYIKLKRIGSIKKE